MILAILEQAFERARKDKGMAHPFPYDTTTNTIRLPANLEKDLRDLIRAGNKIEAVKRVTRLTGAGLRISKDYVDGLVESKQTSKRKRA
jgi:ribosomal protein L7/L12